MEQIVTNDPVAVFEADLQFIESLFRAGCIDVLKKIFEGSVDNGDDFENL